MSPRAQVFFLFSLSRPSSSLAPRHVIFPRIKLSWWNKAEGVRRRGRGRSLGLWLLSLMNLSDWRDEAEPAVFPFTGSCCVSFSLSLFFLCPFKSLHFHFLTFTLFYLLFFSSITLSVLDFSPSPCPCLILNSITKPFYWLAILKINLADKSETLLLSVSFSLSSPPTTHTHTHTHTHTGSGSLRCRVLGFIVDVWWRSASGSFPRGCWFCPQSVASPSISDIHILSSPLFF